MRDIHLDHEGMQATTEAPIINADNELSAGIKSHLGTQWPDFRLTIEQWTKGPTAERMPDLRIAVLAPPTGKPWVYTTIGASQIDHGATCGTELFLLSRSFDRHHLELLTLVAYMHRDPARHLSVGHTMNLGPALGSEIHM